MYLSTICCLVLLVFDFYKNDSLVYVVSGDVFLIIQLVRFIYIVACSYGAFIFHCYLVLQHAMSYFLFHVVPVPCISLASPLLRDQLYHEHFLRAPWPPSVKRICFPGISYTSVQIFAFKTLATICNHVFTCSFSCSLPFFSRPCVP